jgi:hypothetical protein
MDGKSEQPESNNANGSAARGEHRRQDPSSTMGDATSIVCVRISKGEQRNEHCACPDFRFNANMAA